MPPDKKYFNVFESPLISLDFVRKMGNGESALLESANIDRNAAYKTKTVCTISTNLKVNIWYDCH